MATARDREYAQAYGEIFLAVSRRLPDETLGMESHERARKRRIEQYPNDRGFKFGRDMPGFEYCVGFWESRRDRVQAYTWLARPHRSGFDHQAFNQRVYDELCLREEQITSELIDDEQTAIVKKMPTSGKDGYGSFGVGIAASPDGAIVPEPELVEWMVVHLQRVEQVMRPHLEEILADLRSP